MARPWLLSLLLLLVVSASLAADEPIIILRGDSLVAEKPNLKGDVDGYVARARAALDAVGVPYRVVSDEGLDRDALAGALLTVLPYNKLDEQQVAVLRGFVEAGGRLAAFFTTGHARLPALLGVELGELQGPAREGELAAIRFTDAAREAYPLLPEALDQDSWHAFALNPQPGTRVMGVWGQPAGEADAPRAAITENDAGVYVGHVMMPGDLTDKGLFLLSLAARSDPSVWRDVLARRREQALAAVAAVTERWAQLQQRADLPEARREELAQAVLGLGARASLLPPPEPQAAPTAMDLYDAVQQEAEAMRHRMYVSRPYELRGLWVFAARPIDWPKLAAQCRDAGINAIFYRVGRGGNVIYPSKVLPQDEWSKGRDEVAEAIKVCHRYGIEFHAWRVNYHLGSAPDDYVEKLRQAGRLSIDAVGKEAEFANPGDPRNLATEIAAMKEVVENYDVDGLHLDYIRYTEVPSYEFDYSPVSRREFEKVLGRPVADWPADVVRGELKETYEEWLRGNIHRTVRETAQMIEATKPQVALSAAVWPNHRTHRFTIKQDWIRWLDEGWLDILVPMSYTADPETFAKYAKEQVSLTRGNTRIALGLGIWLVEDRPDAVSPVLEQIRIARDHGADGFVLFSGNAANLDAVLEAMALGVSAEKTPPANQAPPVHWRLPTAEPMKDAPLAVQANTAVPVEVRLGPGAGTLRQPVQAVSATLKLVDPATGREVVDAGQFVALGGTRAELTTAVEIPTGLHQLVVRGKLVPETGRDWEFTVRGPLIEGRSEAAWADWQRSQQPYQPQGDGTQVGIWHNGIGSEPILAALQERNGVAAAALHRFEPAHLEPFDVIIVPQLRDPGDFYGGAVAALRQWVEQGGTLVLTHDAVGFRWHLTPFPAVGWGEGISRAKSVVAAPALDRLPGLAFEHAYADHVRIKPGPQGTVLVREAPGDDGKPGAPVVVEGRVGQGRVVLDGMLSGYVGDRDAIPAPELKLLLAAAGLPLE